MIGCGIMFTGLLLGALSGSISIMLEVVGLGALVIGITVIQRYTKDRQTQARLKQYPTYRY